MGVRIKQTGTPYQEYEIPITSTPSTAQLLALKDLTGVNTVEYEAKGDDAVICFGSTSAVVASGTVAANALTAPNFSLTAGAIEQSEVQGQSQKYVSVVSRTGLNVANAILVVRLCQAQK